MKEEFSPWRKRTHEIIFEADTKLGKVFDVSLLFLIIFSVILVMLESVSSINNVYGYWFKMTEWVITILFTIEYIFLSTRPYSHHIILVIFTKEMNKPFSSQHKTCP